jgi:hypothetical protein
MGSNTSKPADVAVYVDRLCGGMSGCRVMVGENRKVVVADAPTWTDDMSQCIKGRFPGAQISVCQCNSSMSGFSVVIDLPAASGGLGIKVFILLLAVVAFSVLVVAWPSI